MFGASVSTISTSSFLPSLKVAIIHLSPMLVNNGDEKEVEGIT